VNPLRAPSTLTLSDLYLRVWTDSAFPSTNPPTTPLPRSIFKSNGVHCTFGEVKREKRQKYYVLNKGSSFFCSNFVVDASSVCFVLDSLYRERCFSYLWGRKDLPSFHKPLHPAKIPLKVQCGPSSPFKGTSHVYGRY
ncbi:hypothetical protein CEXT_597421, partial [Caerostris extrusa]